MLLPSYTETVQLLSDRILALIDAHESVLSMKNPFKLFGFQEFECSDLGPSLLQAQMALELAQARYRSGERILSLGASQRS